MPRHPLSLEWSGTANVNGVSKEKVDAGDYTNDSEYIRDLIRREQERGAEIEAVRGGYRAGPSDSQETILARARSVWQLRVAKSALGKSTRVALRPGENLGRAGLV